MPAVFNPSGWYNLPSCSIQTLSGALFPLLITVVKLSLLLINYLLCQDVSLHLHWHFVFLVWAAITSCFSTWLVCWDDLYFPPFILHTAATLIFERYTLFPCLELFNGFPLMSQYRDKSWTTRPHIKSSSYYSCFLSYHCFFCSFLPSNYVRLLPGPLMRMLFSS